MVSTKPAPWMWFGAGGLVDVDDYMVCNVCQQPLFLYTLNTKTPWGVPVEAERRVGHETIEIQRACDVLKNLVRGARL